MFYVIFDYNYGEFWLILIFFLQLETGMNTLPNMYELFHFNLTVSPLYLVKLKIAQKQPTAYTVYSVERIVPDFCSFQTCSFHCCLLANSLTSLQAENHLHCHGFYQKFIFKLNMGNFNM